MSIVYPLAMPSSPSPRTVTFGANNIVSVAVSPFTGSAQIQTWPGEWWECDVALPPMPQSSAEAWKTWLIALRGLTGTFLIGDPMRKTPNGVASGTPLVSGAQTAGSKTLVTTGWTPNTPQILKAGDYIQVGNGTSHGSPAVLYPQRLYKVLTDVNSDSGGNATLDIFPCLRSEGVYNGESISVTSCVGVFRLAGNWRQWRDGYTRLTVISFKAVESI